MATLLRLTLTLLSLFAVSAGVSHWLATRQPVPVSAVFNNPDGTTCEHPCLFGVQAGFTTFDRAGSGEVDQRTTLTERIGPRARSRLFEMCKVIRMPVVEDYRVRRRGTS